MSQCTCRPPPYVTLGLVASEEEAAGFPAPALECSPSGHPHPQRDVVPLVVVGIHQDVNRAPALEGELVEHRHSVKGVHLPRLRVLPLSRQVAATWELFDRGDDGSHPHATLFKSLNLLRSIKEQARKEQEESYEQDDCGFHDLSLPSLKTSLAA